MDASQLNPNYIIINSKTKNNIMANSDFWRIYYSDENVSFNGVYIKFKLKDIMIDKYFSKIKCCFKDNEQNKHTINKLLKIEKIILNKMINTNNCATYRIEEQLNQYFIKIFPTGSIKLGKYDEITFLLKISGLWSTDIQKKYGLTFRFFIVENI